MGAKIFAIAAVAAITLTVLAVSTDADAVSKTRRYYSGTTTSLDGRITGYPRTCGFDYFLYDRRGVPRGPYCH
jgi:hypothetical protein